MDVLSRFRPINRVEPTLDRTRQKKFDQAPIGWRGFPLQTIISALDAFDLEFLPRLDPIEPPQVRRQDNLAFGRNGGVHGSKISSYLPPVNGQPVLGSFSLRLIAFPIADKMPFPEVLTE